MSRSAVPGVVAKTHRNGETKNKERSIDIKKILKVEIGTGQFPGSNGTKGQLSSWSAKLNSLANAVHVPKTIACMSAHLKTDALFVQGECSHQLQPVVLQHDVRLVCSYGMPKRQLCSA